MPAVPETSDSQTRPTVISERWYDSVVAAFFCTVMAVVFALADATVLFGTVLPQFLPVAVAMTLVSAVVLAAVVAMLSGFRGCIAGAQEATIVILAGMVASVGDILASSGESESVILTTVVFTILLSTFIVGVCCWLAGYWKLGRFIRYFPYPVVAGFLAGAGLLLVKYSLLLLASTGSASPLLDSWLTPSSLVKFGLVIMLVVALIYASRPGTWRYAVPIILIAATSVFVLLVLLGPVPVDYWQQNGWMLSESNSQPQYPTYSLSDISDIRWDIVMLQFPQLVVLVLVTLIASLIKFSALEVALSTEVDNDKELRTSGIANMLSGVSGGTPGFATLSLTMLAQRLNSSSRLVGVLVALMCSFALVFSGELLMYMPRFIFSAMIFWVGTDLLIESLIKPFHSSRRFEFFIIFIMMMIIVFFGFFTAFIVGLIAGAILFVIDYSRINVIRQRFSGTDMRSNVDRNTADQQLLIKHGDNIVILRIFGYLFFGTAYRFIEQVKASIGGDANDNTKYLVLDFEKVNGIDGSANQTLSRLHHLAQTHQLQLVISSASESVRNAVVAADQGGLHASSEIEFFDTLDSALEWCEDQQLLSFEVDIRLDESVSLDEWLGPTIGDAAIKRLVHYMEPIMVDVDETLFRKNSLTNSLYLVKSGSLDIVVTSDQARQVRIRKVGPGAILGEVSLYLDQPTTASVIARQPSELLRLSRANLKSMLQEQPKLAAIFHERMAKVLASRLADNSRLIQVLANS